MSGALTVAALFVQVKGCYAGVEGVDPWPEARDARTYKGPWPVVAHPPGARWGRYATGGPAARERREVGDDAGCFASALSSVRRWGGVLEHPANSKAFARYGRARPPRSGGWVPAGDGQGFVCCVEQGRYGHPAAKATWLYSAGVALPELAWGRSPAGFGLQLEGLAPEARRRAIRTGRCQRLSHLQREATPPAFRDLLLSIARGAPRDP